MTCCFATSALLGTSLSTSTTVLLIAAAAVLELALLVLALVDVLRRPDEAVTGGRRWVWILLIVLMQTLGPIIYFAAGRRPRPVTDPGRDGGTSAGGAPSADARPADRVGRTVDVLYGQDATDDDESSPSERGGLD